MENVAAAEDDLTLSLKVFPADGALGHVVVPPGQRLGFDGAERHIFRRRFKVNGQNKASEIVYADYYHRKCNKCFKY